MHLCNSTGIFEAEVCKSTGDVLLSVKNKRLVKTHFISNFSTKHTNKDAKQTVELER